jgi:hypothetical protein
VQARATRSLPLAAWVVVRCINPWSSRCLAEREGSWRPRPEPPMGGAATPARVSPRRCLPVIGPGRLSLSAGARATSQTARAR